MYYVICGISDCVSGQGPSKKAAKHQAAEAALNILQIDAGTVWVELKFDKNDKDSLLPNVNIFLLIAVVKLIWPLDF